MELYLIRHGIAVAPELAVDDAERWLTNKGIQKTLSISTSLRRIGVEFDVLLASPLVRAQQTANLIVSKGLCDRQDTHADLAPNGSLESWIEWLQDHQYHHPKTQKIAVVGHEPDLSTWAERLVFNQVFHRIQLKKAGIIALEWSPPAHPLGNCDLKWLIPPKCWL